MKGFRVLLFLAVLSALGLTAGKSYAQQAIGEVIKAKDDANKLVTAYFNPLGKTIGHNLNSGWFNSGKAMKLGRFDVRLFGTAAFGSKEDETFDISTLGLSSRIRLAPGQTSTAPTAFGQREEGPELVVYGNNPYTNTEEELGRFNTPQGLGYKITPLPMAQISLGLFLDTEVAVRYFPKTTYDEYQGSLWGVGLKHGLKQWLPFAREKEDVDITIFGGYTHLETSANLSFSPAQSYRNQPVAQSSANFQNQQLVYNTKALTASLIVSKIYGVVTLYGGARYSNVNSTLKTLGNYPLINVRTQTLPPFYQYFIDPVATPIDVEVTDSQYGATGGFRLKFSIFSIYAEGTYARYPTATAGIGLGYH